MDNYNEYDTNQICARLRNNDPSFKFLSIADAEDAAASLFGEALRGNTHVEKITLFFSRFTEAGNFDSLLNFIETSSSLVKIGFFFSDKPAVIDRFLNAVSRSPNIKEMEL
jgi:hypothetical protein